MPLTPLVSLASLVLVGILEVVDAVGDCRVANVIEAASVVDDDVDVDVVGVVVNGPANACA